mmetsp:Transcript_18709/g.58132  ORF Transcript_18709/g.58132 Transcript_18709/m.58132 type:complete len:291 (-) Transcript_18709:162-1034(-)
MPYTVLLCGSASDVDELVAEATSSSSGRCVSAACTCTTVPCARSASSACGKPRRFDWHISRSRPPSFRCAAAHATNVCAFPGLYTTSAATIQSYRRSGTYVARSAASQLSRTARASSIAPCSCSALPLAAMFFSRFFWSVSERSDSVSDGRGGGCCLAATAAALSARQSAAAAVPAARPNRPTPEPSSRPSPRNASSGALSPESGAATRASHAAPATLAGHTACPSPAARSSSSCSAKVTPPFPAPPGVRTRTRRTPPCADDTSASGTSVETQSPAAPAAPAAPARCSCT